MQGFSGFGARELTITTSFPAAISARITAMNVVGRKRGKKCVIMVLPVHCGELPLAGPGSADFVKEGLPGFEAAIHEADHLVLAVLNRGLAAG